jgi:hypothetical protein
LKRFAFPADPPALSPVRMPTYLELKIVRNAQSAHLLSSTAENKASNIAALN